MDMSLEDIIAQIRLNADVVEKIINNKPLADQMRNWADNLDKLFMMIEKL